MIHSDIWGPSRIQSLTGEKWFITFIDDHTRIKILRTDNGTEYFNTLLGAYLLEQGIIHQSSCIGTPQQNEIVERKNRHLLEVT